MDDTDADRNLGIYMNDHYAGAAGGVDLARRGRDNSTDPERTAMWESIAAEVEEDRVALSQMLGRIDVSPNPVKKLLGRISEKVGRLKPNGQITGPSDLGQFLELEMMVIGVTGKLALWKALRMTDDPRLRSFDFPALIERAESQRERLNEHRLNLAGSIFK